MNKLAIVCESDEDYKDRVRYADSFEMVYQMNLMRDQLKRYYKNE